MLYRSPGSDDAPDGVWQDLASSDRSFRFLVGIMVPATMLVIGAFAIAHQSTSLGRHGSLPLHGLNAIAAGAAWIGLALFTHCRMFWGSLLDNHWLAVLGEILGASAFILGLGAVIIRVGLLNLR